MAHERGQADLECGRSIREWFGLYVRKSRDALVCPRCHNIVYPQSQEGTFDFPYVNMPIWEEHRFAVLAIEVKAGDTSIAFSSVDESKREWAKQEMQSQNRYMYLWFCIGKKIKDKEYPRKTWFFPLNIFYELEQSINRKSIPYHCPELDKYELTWGGDGIWKIAQNHPLFSEVKHEDENNTVQR